jgi:hypothetical protein
MTTEGTELAETVHAGGTYLDTITEAACMCSTTYRDMNLAYITYQ